LLSDYRCTSWVPRDFTEWIILWSIEHYWYPKSGSFCQFLKCLLISLKRISKVSYWFGNVCLRLGQESEIKNFSGPFFRYARVIFQKFWFDIVSFILPSRNLFLMCFSETPECSICKCGDGKNFVCLWLDIEFHQHRLNPYGSQFFLTKFRYILKILKMFINDF